MRHTSTTTRLLLAAMATVCCISSAFGIPAFPGLVNVPQADGTSITLRLVGDERFHYALTPDGYPLIDKDGIYYYASVTDDGNVNASPLKASESTRRSSAERELLRKMDSAAIIKALENKVSQKRTAYFKECDSRRRGPGKLAVDEFPAYGSPKVLVVLVEFSDIRFKTQDPASYFKRMLSEKNFSDYGATGSALDYFSLNSYGKFTPEFEVVGPVKLSKSRSYYGRNEFLGPKDPDAHDAISETCKLIDATVDFTRYDNDGNGVIDGVYVIHAGESEATGGPADAIWPHSSWFSVLESEPFLYDGVKLDKYAISNEWQNGHPAGAGVFIHEFSHILGLPDIYSGVKDIITLGKWSALDMGPYNNECRTPPLYGAFERYALDWIEPMELKERDIVKLRPMAENDACIVKVSDQEYFLFENRQQTGWDTFIPGHGMLAWHIDYDPSKWLVINHDANHQHVDLLEADGTLDEDTRAGDAFPGTAGITSLTDDTNPSMRSWAGLPLNVPLTDITETDGIIRFKVCGGLTEVAVPHSPEVSVLTPWGCTLTWEPVENAVDYKVAVRRADGAEVPEPRLTGGVATIGIEGLDESTTYLCGVQAIGPDGYVSEMSGETEFTTPEMSFAFTRPEGLTATVDGGSFTLRWDPLAEADSYEVSVWGVAQGDPFRTDQGFDNGVTLPVGWTQQGCVAMSNGSYAGESAPSLKMAPDAWLKTVTVDDDIKEISLWLRGISPKAGAEIMVEALCGGEWKEWGRIAADSSEGRTETLTDAPSGSRAVRLTFRSAGGSVAIDDLTILWGAEEVLVAEQGFSPATANEEMVKVLPESGLTRYVCSVTGISGTVRSLPSERVEVTVPASAVESVSTDAAGLTTQGRTLTVRCEDKDTTLEINDLAGRRLLRRALRAGETFTYSASAPGVLLVRAGNRVEKILLN